LFAGYYLFPHQQFAQLLACSSYVMHVIHRVYPEWLI
jgi:hypothetical protein